MSLYKGITAPLVGSMAENAILFWMYGHCKKFVLNVSSMASGGTEPIWAARFEDTYTTTTSSSNRSNSSSDDADNDGDEHSMSLLQLASAGACAGFGAATVLTPVELVKCRMQVQNNIAGTVAASGAVGSGGSEGFVRYKSPLDVVWRTVRDEGVARGLFRGHTSTLLREIPGKG